MKKSALWKSLAWVLMLGLTACGGSDDPKKEPQPSGKPGVVSVSLWPESLELEVGGERTLSVTVKGRGTFDDTVTWSSSDETIATVEEGHVVAVAAGQATIEATSVMDPTKSASIPVTVVAPPSSPGKLRVVIEGLPEGRKPGILVRGPGGFEETVDEDRLFEDLLPGTYTLTAEVIAEDQVRYVPREEKVEAKVEDDHTAVAWVSFETVPDPFDFTLSANAVELPQSGAADLRVVVTRTVGESPVTLTLEGLPNGVTAESSLVVEAEDSEGIFTLFSDGSLRDFENFPLRVHGFARGVEVSLDVELSVRALVLTDADGGPGSLRHFLELAEELEREEPLEIVFPSEMTISPASPLVVTSAVILRGRADAPGSEPKIVLDGGEQTQILRVEAGASAEIQDVLFRNGRSPDRGGAIENEGVLLLRNAWFVRNEAKHGGAIFNSDTLEVTGGTFDRNGALEGIGGAIASYGGNAFVERALFRKNMATFNGGAIWAGVPEEYEYEEDEITLRIQRTIFEENHADHGGGVASEGAQFSIVASDFDFNIADTLGGGLFVDGGKLWMSTTGLHGNLADEGAGIMAQGELTLTGCTLSGNIATNGGGGIHATGALTVFQSTLAENKAALGGGVFVAEEEGARLDLIQSTVSGNQATRGGGIHNGQSTSIARSIVHGNEATVTGADILDVAPEVEIESLGHNLFGDLDESHLVVDPELDFVVEEDAGLEGLEDNGGLTKTMALTEESPALDRIPAAECVDLQGEPLAVDQRGQPRPVGEGCDIGAYEWQPPEEPDP